MVGSIDPRCETVRGTHWPVKVAGVFGTRVAENHLGQRFKATASTGRTYGCKRSDQTLKNSCGTGAVHIWSSRRGNHLGQRPKATASTGRTYGCKRSDQTVEKTLVARGPSTYVEPEEP